MSSLELDAKIYIAGHNGLVGSALWRYFVKQGYSNLIGWRSTEVDLRNREKTIEAITSAAPDVVIMAAAKVGGIVANNTYPVEFLQDNVRIQTNVFEGSHIANVKRLLFLGSSCIYPKFAEQPIKETSLLTGPLEPTNDAYAIAKIAGVLNIQAYRREYDKHWISGMPTNLYGQGDNFDLQNSHVLPAMIRKFHEAKVSDQSRVVLWGTGSPMREFLHVDDLAQACHYLLLNYDDPAPVNIGWGEDVTIKELAEIVQETVGFTGEIVWDTDKPDGTPRKLLDTSKINNLGWKPTIQLRDGIRDTYAWYLANQTS
ncbi:MAG: GDP-L-fucose synthase [Actinomycetes bacterium]